MARVIERPAMLDESLNIVAQIPHRRILHPARNDCVVAGRIGPSLRFHRDGNREHLRTLQVCGRKNCHRESATRQRPLNRLRNLGANRWMLSPAVASTRSLRSVVSFEPAPAVCSCLRQSPQCHGGSSHAGWKIAVSGPTCTTMLVASGNLGLPLLLKKPNQRHKHQKNMMVLYSLRGCSSHSDEARLSIAVDLSAEEYGMSVLTGEKDVTLSTPSPSLFNFLDHSNFSPVFCDIFTTCKTLFAKETSSRSLGGREMLISCFCRENRFPC